MARMIWVPSSMKKVLLWCNTSFAILFYIRNTEWAAYSRRIGAPSDKAHIETLSTCENWVFWLLLMPEDTSHDFWWSFNVIWSSSAPISRYTRTSELPSFEMEFLKSSSNECANFGVWWHGPSDRGVFEAHSGEIFPKSIGPIFFNWVEVKKCSLLGLFGWKHRSDVWFSGMIYDFFRFDLWFLEGFPTSKTHNYKNTKIQYHVANSNWGSWGA
jgi:hypothetical protein